VAVIPHIASAPLFAPIQSLAPEEAVVIFTGDIMLDRYVRKKMQQFGEDHTFSGVSPFLAEADLVAGNLEGPITSNDSVSEGTPVGDVSNMRFTFPTTTPEFLKRYGFGLVSLGNNHMFDYGREGVEETKQLLKEAGISFVGDPLREAPEIVVREVEGLRLAFVGYNEFFEQEPSEVEEAIKRARQSYDADAVIVLAHWGDEYVLTPPDRVVTAGRGFIDAGADLIIGSHPHVRQPFEDYNGGRIYYSLGNFAFDQYWDKEVMCGTAVVAHVTERGIYFTEQDIGMTEDGRTVLGCK
jgi:poly-gamma-glutamate synthesis protein (capsule biosynthesis protein)